jgi:hypothetical protein
MSDTYAEAVAKLVAITDPLDMNEAAVLMGLSYATLKNDAANKEAQRTIMRARIEQGLRDGGSASSDKAAERMAREDERYKHCEELSELELSRDIAEVLYKAAHQRAWLLGKGLSRSKRCGSERLSRCRPRT